MNIKQRAAFAKVAEEKTLQARKNKKKGKKNLTPTSRKGKSKFKY
jgi:hypothetical protein